VNILRYKYPSLLAYFYSHLKYASNETANGKNLMICSKVIRKTRFVCQFFLKRYFRILKTLDDVKQLNIRNIGSVQQNNMITDYI